MYVIFFVIIFSKVTLNIGLTSGTCSMSPTTYSTDSNTKTFDMACEITMEESPSSGINVDVFVLLFNDSNFCTPDGKTIENLYTEDGISKSISCSCEKENTIGTRNVDSIYCENNNNFLTSFSTDLSFTFKYLILPSINSVIYASALFYSCAGSTSCTQIMGSNFILASQNPLFISIDQKANQLQMKSYFALSHPIYCKLEYILGDLINLKIYSGVCSLISTNYDINCTFSSTTNKVTFDYPFSKSGFSSTYLVPKNYYTLASIDYNSVVCCSSKFGVINVIEPISGNIVETVKTQFYNLTIKNSNPHIKSSSSVPEQIIFRLIIILIIFL